VLIPLKDQSKFAFYANQVINEQLGVSGLRKQIEQKVYERIAIANTQLPDKKHHLSDSFKDPYILDFLNLPASYLENDLETAIL
jgi:predicted nuclease of restriction endonuclease-like (RecB) superfamily